MISDCINVVIIIITLIHVYHTVDRDYTVIIYGFMGCP